MSQLRDGEWYQANDDNWYCWPDPTPHPEPPQDRPLPPPPPPSAPAIGEVETAVDSDAPSAVAEEPRPGRRWLPFVAATAVLLIAGGAVFAGTRGRDGKPFAGSSPSPSASPSPTSMLVSGTFTLFDDDMFRCVGTGGYSDIGVGTQVTVKNEAGLIIATGSLEEGTLIEGESAFAKDACRFPFAITDVPISAFYSFEVARRGALNYSHAEMESMGWQVDLSLGS